MKESTPAHIDKDSNGHTGTEESWLTVSDWVTFLSAEKQGLISTSLTVIAVVGSGLLALVAILATRFSWLAAAVVLSAFVVFGVWTYWGLLKPLIESRKRAEEILGLILRGKLTHEVDIRTRWKVELEKAHKDKH
jgi:hypothetical protein